MKSPLILLLMLAAKVGFAQRTQVITYVGIEPIATKNVTPWVVNQLSSYAGTYHFGFSEWESEVELKATGSSVTAVERRYLIPAGGSPRPLPPSIKRFTHVRIIGSRFYSDQVNGEFVSFTDEEGLSHGLRLYPSWNFKKQKAAEIGVRVM